MNFEGKVAGRSVLIDVNKNGLLDTVTFKTAAVARKVGRCHYQEVRNQACSAFIATQAKETTWINDIDRIELHPKTEYVDKHELLPTIALNRNLLNHTKPVPYTEGSTCTPDARYKVPLGQPENVYWVKGYHGFLQLLRHAVRVVQPGEIQALSRAIERRDFDGVEAVITALWERARDQSSVVPLPSPRKLRALVLFLTQHAKDALFAITLAFPDVREQDVTGVFQGAKYFYPFWRGGREFAQRQGLVRQTRELAHFAFGEMRAGGKPLTEVVSTTVRSLDIPMVPYVADWREQFAAMRREPLIVSTLSIGKEYIITIPGTDLHSSDYTRCELPPVKARLVEILEERSVAQPNKYSLHVLGFEVQGHTYYLNESMRSWFGHSKSFILHTVDAEGKAVQVVPNRALRVSDK